MTIDNIRFTFSDTVTGYVTSFDEAADAFGLRTSDGREFTAHLTGNTFAMVVRNLGEPYQDATDSLRDMLVPGRLLFAYGIFYAEGDGHTFEVKQIRFPDRRSEEYVFEQPRWWIEQADAIADFYLRGQFPDGNYDWRNYRTKLSLEGKQTSERDAPDFRQETDTISRLVYGLATAYMLTGEDRFIEAAERGTEYLRDHMRVRNDADGVVYWYHGIDVSGSSERKVYASQFGDDYDAIPMYEQIYALAGPTQVYRVTGDPRILSDIDETVALFDRFYKDEQQGGYFSHLDPVTFDPRSDALGHNRARKNWNSVGDHAPAYLINALLATGRKDLEDFLVTTGDTIVERFPDDDYSPFVQERFHEDWTPDRRWGWQQDNAVVGHNLKIAWNLMRIQHRRPKQEYEELARKIAAVMPAVGSDQQRGGWYDVMERTLKEGHEHHRLVWHDRKAWWQQEQGILAYLVLAGTLSDPGYLRLARESAAFYNAFFLDHDAGGVYFNVLADGTPYLEGTERLKGSHSMSGYHSIELCYLAQVYINLLITEEPLELHFKPTPDALPDRLLRVAPDLFAPDNIRITDVWIEDQPYQEFDAEALTVQLPEGSEQVRVRVRILPTLHRFDARYEVFDGIPRITLQGALDADQVPRLRHELDKAIADQPGCLVLAVDGLDTMSRDALNELLSCRGKLAMDGEIIVVSPNPDVAAVLEEGGSGNFVFQDDKPQPPTSPSTT
jgi:anti-anti-sigma factor